MKSKYYLRKFAGYYNGTVVPDLWTCVAVQNVIGTRHKVFVISDGFRFLVVWDSDMPHLVSGQLTVEDICTRRVAHFKSPIKIIDRKRVYFVDIV